MAIVKSMFNDILDVVRRRKGIGFAEYRREWIERGLANRMAVLGRADKAGYLIERGKVHRKGAHRGPGVRYRWHGEFDVTKHTERAWKIFRQAICREEVHEQCEQAARRVRQ